MSIPLIDWHVPPAPKSQSYLASRTSQNSAWPPVPISRASVAPINLEY